MRSLFPEIEEDRRQQVLIADALLARASGEPRRWNDDGTLNLVPAIQREIAQTLRAHAPDPEDEPAGKCLYIAHAVAIVLHNAGLRPVIQAGSLQWPIMPREDDDGHVQTHFAYLWNPGDLASIIARATGALPEMHVWVGLIEPQTLIDFSTASLRKHAEACGLTWRSGDPPAYLWATEPEMPDWVVYTPNREATLYACGILENLFHPKYLRR
jgi:hypothetical protein